MNDLRGRQARRARQLAQTLLVHAPQTGEAYVARNDERPV